VAGTLRVVVFVLGAAVVALTMGSVVRTVVLPRALLSSLNRFTFMAMRVVFRTVSGSRERDFARWDRINASYAPVSLLALLMVWLILITAGYTAIFWALGDDGPREAFVLSGSSLLTLGFARRDDLPSVLAAFSEAAIGLLVLALLIGYLPTIYGAFTRRELFIAKLEVRAGSPPTGVELLSRAWRIGRLDRLADLWVQTESWFSDIEESHTSNPAVSFFRSPQPDHSWVTGAGAVLVDEGERALHRPGEPLHRPRVAGDRVGPDVERRVRVGPQLPRHVVERLAPDALLHPLAEDRLGRHGAPLPECIPALFAGLE